MMTVLLAAVLAATIAVRTARACENPVYRIFYEREIPENYSLVYYHADGAEADPAVAGELRKLAEERRYTLNATIIEANLDEREQWHEGSVEFLLHEMMGRPEAPFFVLAAPRAHYAAMDENGPKNEDELPPGVLYAGGQLGTDELSAMVSSPARRRVAEMLAAGRHGVLVLLEGSSRLQNDAATASVLLATDDDLDDEGQPINSGFVRVDPADPAEKWFVRQLRRHPMVPPDMDGAQVFAVFGRGLVLQPMFGTDLNPETVEFVVTGILNAPCTCIARDQLLRMTLPMLLDYDWDTPVETSPEDDPLLVEMPPPHLATGLAAALVRPLGAPSAPLAASGLVRSGAFLRYLGERGLAVPTSVHETGRSMAIELSDAITVTRAETDAPGNPASGGGRSILNGVVKTLATLAVVAFLGAFLIMTRKHTA